MSIFTNTGTHRRVHGSIPEDIPLTPEHTMPIPALVRPDSPPDLGPEPQDPPAPARPYVAGPEPVNPLTAPSWRIAPTLGAHIARSIPGADDQFTLRCGCGRTYGCHGHASFAALHDAARDFGWDTDAFGTWACPACQRQPGYWAPFRPALPDKPGEPAVAEYRLMRRVAAVADPVDELLGDWLNEVYSRGRPWLSVAALRAASGMGRRANRRPAAGKAAAA